MKDNNQLTTAGSFLTTNVDITHKSKRSQRDNILKAMGKPEEEVAKDGDVSVPTFATIEKAIVYYEESASSKTGAEKTLYSQTAKWLREYLTIKQTRG